MLKLGSNLETIIQCNADSSTNQDPRPTFLAYIEERIILAALQAIKEKFEE